MRNKNVASSTEADAGITQIGRMTLAEVRRLLLDCRSDLTTGKITAEEGSVINGAAAKRIKVIRAELRGGAAYSRGEKSGRRGNKAGLTPFETRIVEDT